MTDEARDTAEILQPEPPKKRGVPFKKGYDPRRNLKGVPANAIAARKAIRKLGAELVHIKEKVWDPDSKGWKEVEYDITRYEAMIRLMFSSKSSRDREILLKALSPGLLVESVDLTSGGKPLEPKANDDERFNRAISSLADAIREIVPGTGTKADGKLDAAE